jgi:signal transduction histidine kinase
MDLGAALPFKNGFPAAALDTVSPGPATDYPLQPSGPPRLMQAARRGSIILASLVAALAFTAMMGWVLNTRPLPFPSAFVSINPVTACGLMMASISLLLLPQNRLSRNPFHAGEVLAITVLMIGALKLASEFFHWPINIDTWLFAQNLGSPADPVGRFAPKTAMSFVLMGGGLLLLRREQAYRYAQLFGFVTTIIGVLCLQGYAFGLLQYHVGPNIVLMSASSGFAVTLMGIGMLLAHAQRGAMGVIASDTAGGMIARRLLPAAVVLPMALGLLRLGGETAGWYDARFGVALFTTTFVFILVAVVWATARRLHGLDLKQRAAERATYQSEERVRMLNLELEQRIAERTVALEAAGVANRDLEAFSYSVSHDLRAPLRAISGFSSIVAEDHSAAMDADGLRCLDHVQTSAQQMGQLIDDLLAFSRTGRHALAIRTVSTAEVIKACLTDLKGMQESRRVEITVGEMPDCQADPSLLRQVWLNLLANALKYTRKCDRAVITIGSRREDETDVFFVQDNGAGFDMQYADKLFGVFQRLHLADDYEGTGVGLALVQRVIQRHGGRIWAEGQLNRGATFNFTLTGGSSA